MTAWAVVLLGTQLPLVVADVAFGIDPLPIVLLQGVAAGGLLALTVFDERFRPLQAFALALIAVKLIEVLPVALLVEQFGVPVPPGQWTTVAYLLARGPIALALLGVLLLRGTDRGSLYLRTGDLSARVAPERLPGWRREHPWWLHGTVVGATVVAALAGVLALGGYGFPVGAVPPAELAGLAAIVVVLASVNAFTEEFLFRAAPLADLGGVLGKNHAMVLLGAFFGLSHYTGTPGGPVGVVMTFFLGWWLTKSLLETRGMAFAWTVHFALDVVILSAWFLP